jgi:itaconate CoA-transferase
MPTNANLALPLNGIRVVSVEQAIAIPLATRHLADLGAEVIKIERPGGDFARDYDSLANGLSIHFAWTNRGKKSVVLDLKSEDGRDAALRLVDTAHVFLHNMGPGVMDRLGLDHASVSKRAPDVIYCELSGYSPGGPMQSRKAYDLLIQNETGAAAVSGTSDEPAKVGISIVDISGAMYALSGVLAALADPSGQGRGRHLRFTLFDCVAEWLSVPLLQAKYGGRFQRSGRYHNSIYPYGPFECADGEVVLAVQNNGEWARFCERVLAMPGLATDERFTTNERRHHNRESLAPIIASVLRRLSVETASERLLAGDVPFAEFHSVEEAVHHPELVERGRWGTFGSEAGSVELLRSPFEQEGQWPTPSSGVPALGEHTSDVFESL